MARHALIFDLDGTLWDSYPWYADILESLFETPSEEYGRQLRSGSNIVSLIKNGGAGSKERFIEQGLARIHSLNLFDGVADVFDVLAQRGIGIGIVTSLPGWIAEPLLKAKNLSSRIEGLETARWGVPGKPKPHSLLNACNTLGIEPNKESFYVGDLDVDANAAMNAGLSFAWASRGYGDSRPDYASATIDNFAQVLELL